MTFSPGNPGQRTRKADRVHKIEDISYKRGWIVCICGDEYTLSAEAMAESRMLGHAALRDWMADHLKAKGQIYKL